MNAALPARLVLAAEEAPRSAPVTDWGARLAWTAGVLLVVAGLYLLMWRGWRRRGRRQQDVPSLPPVPPDPGPVLVGPVDGVYVTTTRHGDWLDRVVAHGLGPRSRGTLTVAEAGALLVRRGAPDVFVPAGALTGARLERGLAGKVVEEGGLVVLTWEHGDVRLDTGFRAAEVARHDDVIDAVTGLIGEENVT
jgi:hypothetical protein